MAEIIDPLEVLERAYSKAVESDSTPLIDEAGIRQRLEYIIRISSNLSGVRVVMACALAKASDKSLDARKPYTKIGDSDVFAGRTYDQDFISHLIHEHDLPLNPTTAWLTPAWRNLDRVLSLDFSMVGRPQRMYDDTLKLLDDIQRGVVEAEDVLAEIIRMLLKFRDERKAAMKMLLGELAQTQAEGSLPLSSEDIVGIIGQHLDAPNSSRLPTLVVAAAYKSAQAKLGEQALPLQSHNAADSQTGALGDVEITIVNEDRVVTSYEMKKKVVSIADLDIAIQKVKRATYRPDNYIFVTTEPVEYQVEKYALQLYEATGGIEFAILDCVGFVRHFLHLFHRLRVDYLDAYQELVLADSAVPESLKKLFVTLRTNAQAARQADSTEDTQDDPDQS